MTTPPNDWDQAYQLQNPAPWDIGRPQPAFAALVAQGGLDGSTVLDAGCGTGEHALLMAERGSVVTGIDLAESALQLAKGKAVARGLTVTFKAGDVLTMSLPRQGFDAVVDSGLFHVFDDDDRARYVGVLGDVLRLGGTCVLMCFSDRQPGDWGPRRVTRQEIETAFSDGWSVDSLEHTLFDINPTFGTTSVQAWLAVIQRSLPR